MSLPNIKDIQNLNAKEIEVKIIELKKEIFQLKLQKSTRQNIKPHLFKHKKHQIAQLLTIKNKSIN
uniref:Large ribosomal subunit protein uL29c n=2 Tax=Gracilariopsis TaxID=2781 RepID=A0A1C9CFC0_9FLOR|nr:ribosomal protein L29 [Gracilariopsis lemaneiformis]YP_009294792.1 ribosomal protein L29 [Gracilariopsis chorda]AJO68433.1 ribosomal protein L29 [Gracilariopsis lemaneiformis]AML79892.1 ribosomal protein L29 [Gracilariopsis lemaneiformis]AOM67052.1 ribosomal protein L29 [Gracilariopsis chorda]